MFLERNVETRLDESPPDPYLGRTVDGYRIEEVIGRGGMGVVYRATQLSLGRPVAIKVLPEQVADEPQFLERFHREVDVLSRLAHPNIVTVFERGEVDGRPYVAMEYVAGTSLREVLKQGPLPAGEALSTVRGVLAALEHAHDKGIIHRDIKPENVLVAPGGIVKVADFGLGRLMGPAEMTRLTHTHLMLGTYEYMAPEQREKAKEADARADLYATGVVLYEMIAGELPIGHFEPLSRKRPAECDSRIDGVIERSLRKEPDKRYQRASEMGAEVSQLLSAPIVAAPGPVEEEAPQRHRRRRSRRHRAIVAGLLAGLITAFLLYTGGTANAWLVVAMGSLTLLVLLPPLLEAVTNLSRVAVWLVVAFAIPAAFVALFWGVGGGGIHSSSQQSAPAIEVARIPARLIGEHTSIWPSSVLRDWVRTVTAYNEQGVSFDARREAGEPVSLRMRIEPGYYTEEQERGIRAAFAEAAQAWYGEDTDVHAPEPDSELARGIDQNRPPVPLLLWFRRPPTLGYHTADVSRQAPPGTPSSLGEANAKRWDGIYEWMARVTSFRHGRCRLVSIRDPAQGDMTVLTGAGLTHDEQRRMGMALALAMQCWLGADAFEARFPPDEEFLKEIESDPPPGWVK